jgi:large subunit ribosomal protein L22
MNENLTAIAKDNMVRISPTKLSILVNSIVNMKVSNAINQLKFSSKRVSGTILKVLNAAVANAENNKQLDIDKLFVKEAFVGKSLRMKRWRPRAKGRAASIIKPFSKVTIVVEERTETKKENK